MSHRPREGGDGVDEGDALSEGRAGRPDSRVRIATRAGIVGGLRVIVQEPDPKIARRRLARGKIKLALANVVDLSARRDQIDRGDVENIFRDVCVDGRVPPEEPDPPEPDPPPPAAGASKAA